MKVKSLKPNDPDVKIYLDAAKAIIDNLDGMFN